MPSDRRALRAEGYDDGPKFTSPLGEPPYATFFFALSRRHRHLWGVSRCRRPIARPFAQTATPASPFSGYASVSEKTLKKKLFLFAVLFSSSGSWVVFPAVERDAASGAQTILLWKSIKKIYEEIHHPPSGVFYSSLRIRPNPLREPSNASCSGDPRCQNSREVAQE